MSRDALVVGINTYRDERLPNLQAPAEDAEAIARRLEQDGEFKVWRLPEAINPEDDFLYVGKTTEVTLAQLKKALVQLFKPEGRNIPDTALFYFSGHGLRKTQGIQEGFLATSDVYPEVEFNGLSLIWLRELLQASPVKQQIVWLDCCYSGELLNLDEANPGPYGQARDRCFIAASREFEVAYEDIGDSHSVLTKALLEGLDPNRCPQRWVTDTSLVDYLKQHLKAPTQRPVYNNSGDSIKLTRSWEVPATVLAEVPPQAICPYKGLEYFDCNGEDPKYFYGRAELTDKLIDKVRQSNFLAILGASGSGKSSVLRAGLLHQLKQGLRLSGSEQWEIQIILPGEHPLKNLAEVFVDSNLPRAERAEQLGKAEGLLKEGADGLRRLVQTSGASRVVLVVDQFEEAFTLCRDKSERELFFNCLLGALEQTGDQLCLILTMRADFFGKCVEEEYSGLANQIQQHLVTVTPMNRDQLKKAITKPADRVGLTVEPQLVKKIIEDVEDSPGSLPLLQYTMTELWQRRTDNCLQLKTYIDLGGVSGTLNKRATEVYGQLKEKQKQEAVKHIFLSLTQLGEGTEDTRRRVRQRDLVTAKYSEELIEEVVKKLADEKLIVTNKLPEKGSEAGIAPGVEVAHEALIRHWQQLRRWLDENREGLLQQRRIETAAADWRDKNQKPDYLLRGRQLREARDFQKEYSTRFPLSEGADEFIKKSLKHKRISQFKRIGIFLIIPLLGTYFIIREARLNYYSQLVQKCAGEEVCPGRIKALEELFKTRKRLYRINLKEANLKGVSLEGANLEGANLEGANLEGASLKGANLEGANLEGASLKGVNLEGAYLYSANLYNVNLEGAYLHRAYLKGANLYRANLYSVNLEGAYLHHANLEDAYLYRAYLKGAYLKGANLYSAYLKGAYLHHANLEGAYLYSAYLKGANLIKAKKLTPSQIKSACYWEKAIYKEANQQYIDQLKKDKASDPKKSVDCNRWE